MTRRKMILGLLLASGAWLGPSWPAGAQAYPARHITVVNPFPAGAPLDIIARIVADRMRRSLDQPVVVENVVGAAGSMAVGRAARAAADGYTISIGNFSSHVISASIYRSQFDVLRDFEPVALLASNSQVIVSKLALPANDLRGLVAWLRANPDKAAAGTAGVGSISHVTGVLFQRTTETRFQFVPYRGVNLAAQDLVGGQIDLLFDQTPSALANIRAGKVKAYAVTADKRLASLPGVETVSEAGLPGLTMSVWSALWVPRGTPKNVIATLNAAARDALADPGVSERLADLSLDIPSIDQRTPEALGRLHRAEVEKWWPILDAANIKSE